MFAPLIILSELLVSCPLLFIFNTPPGTRRLIRLSPSLLNLFGLSKQLLSSLLWFHIQPTKTICSWITLLPLLCCTNIFSVGCCLILLKASAVWLLERAVNEPNFCLYLKWNLRCQCYLVFKTSIINCRPHCLLKLLDVLLCFYLKVCQDSMHDGHRFIR